MVGYVGVEWDLGIGVYADYASDWRLHPRCGYHPDGHGLVHQGRTVEPGRTVVLEDDIAIMMTRGLDTARNRDRGRSA